MADEAIGGVDEEQRQRERAIQDAHGGQRELAEHREARKRSREIDIEKVEAARKETEARRAEAREERAREKSEREATVAAEKAAFEEKAFAAKRAKEQEPREREAKVQALRNSHPVSAASQVPTEGAPYAVSKSQEELTSKYVSERYGGTVVTEKRPVPRTFQPTKAKEQERHDPGLQYAERVIPKPLEGSAMHDVATTAIEEHEATAERDYLGVVAKATEVEIKRKAEKERAAKASPNYVPQFEREYRAKTKREEKARLYNPVENQVVTTTVIEAKEFGHQVGHGGNTTIPGSPVENNLPLEQVMANAEPKKTMQEERNLIATERFRTDPLVRENLVEHGLHGKSKGYEKGKPNPTPGIPFESFDPNSPTTLRHNYQQNKEKLEAHEMKRTRKESLEEESERRKKMKSGTNVDFETFEEVAKKNVREEQKELYAKKQKAKSWMGDVDVDQFSNQPERQKANDTIKRNQEMKADYTAGSSRGTMGLLKDILTHPHDTAQEIGYAVEKKVAQRGMERKQATMDSAAKHLEPEYRANDQKLQEGKISREMHELRAKQLDQKFEKMSTPIEQRVGRGIVREASGALDIFNEAMTSPERQKEINRKRISEGKEPIQSVKEGNSIIATFARGVSETNKQLHEKPSKNQPAIFGGATPSPNPKVFGGGKGIRNISPTKGTVISRSKGYGIQFGGTATPGATSVFGNPLGFLGSTAPQPKVTHHRKKK